MAAKNGLMKETSIYQSLFKNPAFMLLWTGQIISSFGDTFFNIAVMWMVYSESGSVLKTALIQVIWHLSSILFGPIAGVWTDQWDRKKIMVITNILSAVVVSVLAGMLFRQGEVNSLSVFIVVFMLNSIATFLNPARFSIMPDIIGKETLSTASGFFSTGRQIALMIGNSVAGIIIAVSSSAWALIVDSISFLIAALAIIIAPLPARNHISTRIEKGPSIFYEILDGWKTISAIPIIRVMVWLSVLINVSSFIGPLYPALVSQRLHGGAAAYGALEAAGVIGGLAGGILAGILEHRIGAGKVLAGGWVSAGLGAFFIAFSTWLPVSFVLEAVQAFGLTVGAIAMGALTQALSPENYRGRVQGISAALSVIALPLSTLLGGFLGDILGPVPLIAAGGLWTLGIALLAWFNPVIRNAFIK